MIFWTISSCLDDQTRSIALLPGDKDERSEDWSQTSKGSERSHSSRHAGVETIPLYLSNMLEGLLLLMKQRPLDGLIHSWHSWLRCYIYFFFSPSISLKYYSKSCLSDFTAHFMTNTCFSQPPHNIVAWDSKNNSHTVASVSLETKISQINEHNQPMLLPHMWVWVIVPSTKPKHRWVWSVRKSCNHMM